ncbi:uncharacterized protein LOC103712981 [Phoenix dactylifera]|uniref:Uncharacterized protein LOC103712981 n=1 Tax=Phoenix dactylifera TaxID=42345 RepID=A0A8B7CFN2_PHODC|nr:uncharacterized protein LOC103712981 [Phoenix dactylifera]
MAASAAALLLAVLSLLSAAATARPGVHFHPCNTLLISYSFSSSSASSSGDSLVGDPAKTHPTGFFAVYRIITPFRPLHTTSSFGDLYIRPAQIRRPGLPRRAAVVPAEPVATAFGFSSLQERAKDILVVVVGLLFGVGCGALTAATMYLIWSLVTNRYEICGADVYSEEEDEVDEGPKKGGYVKIPATEQAPAKEGYEGN